VEDIPFEELEHTADWSLRVHGRDLADLFQVAASAMLAACGARAGDGPLETRSATLDAPDGESLLVRWLEEVLYRLEPNGRCPVKFELALEGATRLKATWTEGPLLGVDKPIKAVTFHNLTIDETAAGAQATIVFDV
jgi:SHS2 domain-containing protein